MPPPDKDDPDQTLLAIAVNLASLNTTSQARTTQLDKIEKGVDKINDRVRMVEIEQGAIRGRMKLLSGLGALITGAFATVIAYVNT